MDIDFDSQSLIEMILIILQRFYHKNYDNLPDNALTVIRKVLNQDQEEHDPGEIAQLIYKARSWEERYLDSIAGEKKSCSLTSTISPQERSI